MLRKIYTHPYFHIVIVALIMLGVLVCVFPEMIPSLSWVVNYAVQLMLFYLLAGLVILFLKQPKLTFAFFGGCVLLCFFMKFSIKGDGIERWRQHMHNSKGGKHHQPIQPYQVTEIKIIHINLSNANSRSEVMSLFNETDADILSVHEVTPIWNQFLNDSLGVNFTNRHTMVDIGIFGMAIYSKHNLIDVDTFYFNEIPNLKGKVKVADQTFDLFSIHTQPALEEFSKKRLAEHMTFVGDKISSSSLPTVVLGDFNAVFWSNQIRLFLDATGLMESRTGFMPNSLSGKISFWDLPLDHIFYSGEFTCSNFQNIEGVEGQHLGVMGIYKLFKRTVDDQTEDQ